MSRRRAHPRTLILACLALVAACVLTPAAIRARSSHATPAPTAIPDRLHGLAEQAQTQGHVRVIVSLRVPATQASHALTANALASAQPSIRQARDSLIAALQGTTVSVNAGKDWVIPALALTVDAKALARLQSSPLVASVVQDGQSRPLDTGSDALIGAPAAWSVGYTGQGQTVAVLDTGVQFGSPVPGEPPVRRRPSGRRGMFLHHQRDHHDRLALPQRHGQADRKRCRRPVSK